MKKTSNVANSPFDLQGYRDTKNPLVKLLVVEILPSGNTMTSVRQIWRLRVARLKVLGTQKIHLLHEQTCFRLRGEQQSRNLFQLKWCPGKSLSLSDSNRLLFKN